MKCSNNHLEPPQEHQGSFQLGAVAEAWTYAAGCPVKCQMITGTLNLGGVTISCAASPLISMYVIVSGLELKKPLVSCRSLHVANYTKEADDYTVYAREPSTWELTSSRMTLIGLDYAKLRV